MLYSTFIGGSGDDNAYALTLALPPAIFYLAGGTRSRPISRFSTLSSRKSGGGDCSDAFDMVGCNDVFVMRWRPADMTLLYSTFLGGSGNDSANSIAVDTSGGIYLAGSTASPNFPLLNPIQSTLGGGTCQTVASTVTACLQRCLRGEDQRRWENAPLLDLARR